jgi:hypothetical protein
MMSPPKINGFPYKQHLLHSHGQSGVHFARSKISFDPFLFFQVIVYADPAKN